MSNYRRTWVLGGTYFFIVTCSSGGTGCCFGDPTPGLYHAWAMATDDTAAILDSDLPLIRRGFGWPTRVLFVAFGVFIAFMPAWELGRGLWPFNIATPVFAIIIVSATGVGIRFIAGGLSGWGDAWRYAPGAIVVHRSAWGSDSTMRLSVTNVATVEVRKLEDAGHGEPEWQVVLVPKPTFSGLADTAGRGGVFDAGGYGSQAYAERVRRALVVHLGL